VRASCRENTCCSKFQHIGTLGLTSHGFARYRCNFPADRRSARVNIQINARIKTCPHLISAVCCIFTFGAWTQSTQANPKSLRLRSLRHTPRAGLRFKRNMWDSCRRTDRFPTWHRHFGIRSVRHHYHCIRKLEDVAILRSGKEAILALRVVSRLTYQI